MIFITVYRTVDGVIEQNKTVQEAEVDENVEAGRAWVEGTFSSKTHWMDGGVPALRDQCSAALDKTTVLVGEDILITGAIGSTLRITGAGFLVVAVDEDPEVINFDTAGVYRLRFSCFPDLPVEMEVTVNAN